MRMKTKMALEQNFETLSDIVHSVLFVFVLFYLSEAEEFTGDQFRRFGAKSADVGNDRLRKKTRQ